MSEILAIALSQVLWVLMVALIMWREDENTKDLMAVTKRSIELVTQAADDLTDAKRDNMELKQALSDAIYWLEKGSVDHAREILKAREA